MNLVMPKSFSGGLYPSDYAEMSTGQRVTSTWSSTHAPYSVKGENFMHTYTELLKKKGVRNPK